MKALIIILTAPFMLFFTLSVASTAEWCIEQGTTPPWGYLAGIVAMDIIWCICASRCSRESLYEALRRYEKFMNKLFTNH
ncbi:MAG: LysE family translocator [Tannerellaceae bacterium]|jgi:hypothetical protein|nr:LysE family translocator [Tannerellaceae bacterium]